MKNGNESSDAPGKVAAGFWGRGALDALERDGLTALHPGRLLERLTARGPASSLIAPSPAPAAWQLLRHDVVESTMSLARPLPAWSAIVANEQLAGRGQSERRFVSDRGGIYLTAVLPYDGDPLASRGFALAVGWALRAALQKLGVPDVRLKWPNDLMIGRGKIGGILVEQGGRETILVGVGLNVSNRPWRRSPELAGTAATLSEAAETAGVPVPDREDLVSGLLAGIAQAHEVFSADGLEGMVARLNQSWGGVREVEVTFADRRPAVQGNFLGIDGEGALQLAGEEGVSIVVPAHHVERLREI